MDIFCRNVRGFNDPVKRRSFKKWIKAHKPLFGGIVETHVSPDKAQHMVSCVLPGWFFADNYDYSELGKIWVIWHPTNKVSVITKSLQMIICLVKLPFVHSDIIISIVYASSIGSEERRELWSEIQAFSASSVIAGKPWVLVEYFNQVLTPQEQSKASSSSQSRGMRDLNHCLISSHLFDLSYCGNTFTWSNNHTVIPIAKKLDRILVNDGWMTNFSKSLAVFGELGFSDHSPCCLFLETIKPKIRQPFKFLTMLNKNPDFAPLVNSWWSALAFDCSKMLKVAKKLKALKRVIKDFSNENYSHLEKRVKEAFEELQSCQQILLASPSSQALHLEREAHRRWCTLANAEESFLRQKSRICWLEEEIKDVFFSLPKNKAPGPDGYCVEFFTAHWNTVGSDMIDAVMEFYQSGQLLKQWNSTLLTLIPKTPNASRMSEFRPIACCNTIYKVISKLLANRLKAVLPDLIANSQSAFIHGRLLVENILLAMELVEGYNLKNITARGMLKVDLKKAFDSIHWEFITNTLKALNFPPHFVKLINECITTPTFSISVNGESCGYFKGTKGLRQGDAISPYLFTLAMEVFTQMINKSFNNNLIGHHPTTTNPQVTHLAFADDIMVFFDGQKESLQNITKVLQDFENISGLAMNKDKTYIFIAGVNQDETLDSDSLGFRLGSLPIWYLGHRELIASVIYGTVNFWASTFILPKGCVRNIESMCSRFLWSGYITKKPSAKVSWRALCLPKEEGGLGLRCISKWNRTLCLKLIWRLVTATDSLWADWIRNNKIKDGVFWQIDEKKQASWTWKTLLHLRPLASRFLRCVLGNGEKISFWFDSFWFDSFWFDWWSPFGPLIQFLGPTSPCQTGIQLTRSVAQVCSNSGWQIRPARSPQAELLHTYLTTQHVPSLCTESDRFLWKVEDEILDQFNTKKTWEVIRPRQTPLQWTKQVWFKGAIPRHAFMLWITHLNRLPTRSRTFVFHTWIAFTNWLDMPDAGSSQTLRRLVAQATIYTIWTERNARFHNNATTPSHILFKLLDRQIRDAILAKSHRKNFKRLMHDWLKYVY
ncbi:PREDICTED: uncharacterized protein LOC104743514 [Camelina sativa]|uniref:Uncharacterized protein LOC104743514 n=1 Tax=Camelina sativa TaxID=90675 RepID=A0ABM0VY45_CAMSA|nr:PREDICTED: uncharacterized protein LOC104743514 [Camelina sativa]